jgi:hypothetical protein
MLRLTELPALFWAVLAGRESRARLRFILAGRRNDGLRAGAASVEPGREFRRFPEDLRYAVLA